MGPVPVVQQPEHGGIRIAIVFFGFFCILTGYLIFKSTFLPRIIGVLMVIAGLGWSTFLSSPFGAKYFPYVVAAAIGEGLLTLWLLVIGVNETRWKEQASAAGFAKLSGTSTRNHLQEELRSVPDWNAVLMFRKLNAPTLAPG